MFRQTFVRNEENRLRLKSSPWRGLNRGTLEAKILRSNRFSTRLAGPGKNFGVNNQLFIMY